MTRILVVDDDRGILNVIRKALEKEGYQTDTLDDPEKLDFRRLNDYQLILLDVMMPGTDGFSLCRRIRDQVDCPILFVTAKTDEADLMTGLGIGGDDYITKPFGLGELRARVAAHLRRENRERKHVITLGELSFSLNSRQVFFQGAEIPFTKSEYAICEYLGLFQGKDLRACIWVRRRGGQLCHYRAYKKYPGKASEVWGIAGRDCVGDRI